MKSDVLKSMIMIVTLAPSGQLRSKATLNVAAAAAYRKHLIPSQFPGPLGGCRAASAGIELLPYWGKIPAGQNDYIERKEGGWPR